MDGIKRRHEVCRDCNRMIKVTMDGKDSVIGCFCCNAGADPDFYLWLARNGFHRVCGGTPESIVVKSDKLEELDIPDDCDCYEQYFLKDCNK